MLPLAAHEREKESHEHLFDAVLGSTGNASAANLAKCI